LIYYLLVNSLGQISGFLSRPQQSRSPLTQVAPSSPAQKVANNREAFFLAFTQVTPSCSKQKAADNYCKAFASGCPRRVAFHLSQSHASASSDMSAPNSESPKSLPVLSYSPFLNTCASKRSHLTKGLLNVTGS
jgi:hypothetical protein